MKKIIIEQTESGGISSITYNTGKTGLTKQERITEDLILITEVKVAMMRLLEAKYDFPPGKVFKICQEHMEEKFFSAEYEVNSSQPNSNTYQPK
jgi:hypothetical protein